MSLQTAVVKLEIVFDNDTNDHPVNWDWTTLTDVNTAAGEKVTIIEGDGI